MKQGTMEVNTGLPQPSLRERLPSGLRSGGHSRIPEKTLPYRGGKISVLDRLSSIVNERRLHLESEFATLDFLGQIDKEKLMAISNELMQISDPENADAFLNDQGNSPEAYFLYLQTKLASNDDVRMSHTRVSLYNGEKALIQAFRDMPLLADKVGYWSEPLNTKASSKANSVDNNGHRPGSDESQGLGVIYATSGLNKYPLAKFLVTGNDIENIQYLSSLGNDAIKLARMIADGVAKGSTEARIVSYNDQEEKVLTKEIVSRNDFRNVISGVLLNLLNGILPKSMTRTIDSPTSSAPDLPVMDASEALTIIETQLPEITTCLGSRLSNKQRKALVKTYAKVFAQWNDPAYKGIKKDDLIRDEIPGSVLESKERYLEYEGAFSDDCLVTLIEEGDEIYAFTITQSKSSSKEDVLEVLGDSVRHIYPNLFFDPESDSVGKLTQKLEATGEVADNLILFQDLGSRAFDVMKLIERRLSKQRLSKEQKKYIYRAYSLLMVERHLETLAEINPESSLNYLFWTIESSTMHTIAKQRPDCYKALGEVLPDIPGKDYPRIFIYGFTQSSLLESISSPNSFEEKTAVADSQPVIVTYPTGHKPEPAF